ncbi:EAL domain-containing protein [Pararhizobium sp.]|uniref:EAL domain-containing protein n=1 Tax=Pararhizobium sp. TaxID=1977563 RepID=UPI00271DB42C|nr:EAL domain-containing protein [Pararhizobium sp.]MDO9417643.1 EAL domain-containing protein [Pararhizobium sp.]
MRTLVEFLFVGHSPSLVLVAALVCIISSFACINLLHHARKTAGRIRYVWLMVAAIAVGFGVWSTHFVAMLAFQTSIDITYSIAMTVLSLAVAIGVSGLGLWVATIGKTRRDMAVAGAILGLGIVSMHFVGVASMIMGGAILWNPWLVAASVVMALVFGAAAAVVSMDITKRGAAWATVLLVLAICSLHFTAMSALNLDNCFTTGGRYDLSPAMMAGSLAIGSLLILFAALGSLVLDNRERRRDMREEVRRQRDERQIGEVRHKLQMALTHMGHALCLFDSSEQLILHNGRLTEIIGVPADTVLEGLTLRQLCELTALVQNGDTEAALQQAAESYDQHKALIAQPQGGEMLHQLGAGRAARVLHSPIGDGSWVTTIEDVTERKQSEAKIAYLARHDALTGLPNRLQFIDTLEAAIAAAEPLRQRVAVIGIDLDHFKDINDIYGHAVGDTVLQTISSRIIGKIIDRESVARFGGDEFVALKTYVSDSELNDFVLRLETALLEKVEIEGTMIGPGASIGVAVYPQDGDSCDKLLNNADLAMYRAKASIEQKICFYEASMDEAARARRATAKDIWTAMEKQQFFLHYQIQRSVLTEEITGYEVLLRWKHPLRGLVSPAEFIPIAEECGAIVALGDWVLETACREAAEWALQHKIAVNLSALQLVNSNLVDKVASVLKATGLAPSRLELEVTETAIIADKGRALHILRQIKALGVTIAIDDFGTGYSSLETLRSFPFDKIKLDRSFVCELETSKQAKAIVRAVLALGRSLEVPVLAEGVETREQMKVLRIEGCNEVQGFLFGRPNTLSELSNTMHIYELPAHNPVPQAAFSR